MAQINKAQSEGKTFIKVPDDFITLNILKEKYLVYKDYVLISRECEVCQYGAPLGHISGCSTSPCPKIEVESVWICRWA